MAHQKADVIKRIDDLEKQIKALTKEIRDKYPGAGLDRLNPIQYIQEVIATRPEGLSGALPGCHGLTEALLLKHACDPEPDGVVSELIADKNGMGKLFSDYAEMLKVLRDEFHQVRFNDEYIDANQPIPANASTLLLDFYGHLVASVNEFNRHFQDGSQRIEVGEPRYGCNLNEDREIIFPININGRSYDAAVKTNDKGFRNIQFGYPYAVSLNLSETLWDWNNRSTHSALFSFWHVVEDSMKMQLSEDLKIKLPRNVSDAIWEVQCNTIGYYNYIAIGDQVVITGAQQPGDGKESEIDSHDENTVGDDE